MSRARLRSLFVILLTGALVLTGCSKSPEPTTTPGPSSATPTTGTTGTTTGSTGATGAATGSTPDGTDGTLSGRSKSFTVVAPDGWTEATEKAANVSGIDLVVLSSDKVANFSNNLVVLQAAGDASSLAAKIEQGRSEMKGAGRTVSDLPDITVAGEPAKGFATAFEQQGVKVLARSYGVHHGDKVYLLTLSSSQEDADHAAAEFDDILASWKWL